MGLLLGMCACAAAPRPEVRPPPPETSPAPAPSAVASDGASRAELPIEPGSERDADVEPSLAVAGEQLSYGGSAVGGVGEAELARTRARVRGKLDAARKYWPTKHQSAFPTTLPIELSEHHRVLLLRELLQLATTAEFVAVELDVQAKGSRQRVNLMLRSPDSQGSRRVRKELHVSVAPRDQYLLTWREGDTVTSMPYKELFASPPADLDLRAFLAQKIDEEWLANGEHRSASDPKKDIAVLHLDDALTLEELLVVTNALAAPKRKLTVDGKVVDGSAFDLFVY
ncbi:MAG TPA: hypothetical protein VFK05_03065 [Polyangiaceae bacterium]|nr:hypothetical protein [Polyangiaceae bacterium]